MANETTKGEGFLAGGYVLRVEAFTTNSHDTNFADENVDGAFIWYDRSLRLWTVYLLDGETQVGIAQYANTRTGAVREARALVAGARVAR